MMRAAALTWPVLLLSLSSLGTGLLCLAATGLRARMSLWLYAAIAFAFGQGVLATAFEFAALAGWLTTAVVATLMSAGAVVALVAFARTLPEWRATVVRACRAWLAAGLVWKVIALAVVLFFVYGFSAVGGWLIVDSPAFYLAIAKMVGGTGRLTALPGYDPFSSIGLLAELLTAALFRLGMSGTDPRVLPWVSFVPTLALLYGLARACGLGRRGSVLVAAMAVSSSAVVMLWGSGKTDLLAVGPAVAACVVMLVSWEAPDSRATLLVAGLLTGFACVFKLSYLIAFLPVVAVLAIWPILGRVQLGEPAGRRELFTLTFRAAVPLTIGFLLAFAPNLVKNHVILGNAFASNALDPFFSKATTMRVVLTYPLALTYGRYWGEVGTISPLVLAYAPLALAFHPTSGHWTSNRIFAMSAAAVAGTIAWMVLCPSALAPRYILVTLLLFAIPAASAAEVLSRRRALFSVVLLAAVLVVLMVTPAHANRDYPTLVSLTRTISSILGPQTTCSGSHPFERDCVASETINAMASPGDRVLTLTWVRFWLHPDLMQAASRTDETMPYDLCGPTCTPSAFWAIYRARPVFRFIIHDASSHFVPPGAFDSPPPDITVHRLFASGDISVYEVTLGS